MKRPWQIWAAFTACVVVAVAAVGWLTYKAVAADRAEESARRQAAVEENARLALWRMETAISPLVAQESMRPVAVYEPFLATGRASPAASARRPVKDVTPSPLLTQIPERTLLHFQLDSGGRLTSPRVPVGAARDRACPQFLAAKPLHEAEERLDQLRTTLEFKTMLAVLPVPATVPLVASSVPVAIAQSSPRGPSADQQVQQQSRGVSEFQARSQFAAQNAAVPRQADEREGLPASEMPPLMTPFCLKGELFLARRVMVNGTEMIQGCWLDWPAIRTQLLSAIGDLLPAADLQPVASPAAEQSRLLAALPVRLEPGPLDDALPASLSPLRVSLVVAWVSLLLASLAVAGLLQGVISLSERRAAFVSAVTHELRTPLTTFRMYAEMLAEGMLPDEETRRRYLGTLCSEADRLTHLVENVLAYARLERGSPRERSRPVAVAQVLELATERLAGRARQAGLELVVQAADAVRDVHVLADASAVEQILFNLVDNAGKYAATATDRTLHLEVERRDGHVELRLRDHGPGVPAELRRRLFHPFHKSARDAAHSAPGVGLGLSLSRRLARDMGGDLQLDPPADVGACFVLSLPVAA